jgi:hypothetical protein
LSLVELARYSDAALAHIIQGRLEAAGIPAFCFDTGMNVAESIPLLFQVRVMVVDEDRDDALAVLQSEPEAFTGEMPAPEPMGGEHYETRPRRRRWALYCVLAYFGVPTLGYLIWVAARN